MSSRYAIVRAGIVLNVIEWDGVSRWAPPPGTALVIADERAEPGGSWDGRSFSPAPRQVREAQVLSDAIDAQVKVDALASLLAMPGAAEEHARLVAKLSLLKEK